MFNAINNLSALKTKEIRAISKHFCFLQTPLKNVRWSWGAISSQDPQVVILRVWRDEIKDVSGNSHVLLTLKSKFEGKNNPGYKERLNHIEIIKNYKKGFAIVCDAVCVKSNPRKIKSYDPNFIYKIKDIIVDKSSDGWGVLGERISTSDFIRNQEIYN